MFWWIDSYQPVTAPNFDRIGSVSYYLTTAIRQLSGFSVPAFLFISAFFIAYMAKGNDSQISWKMLKSRLVFLLVPYFFWSIIIFSLDYLQGIIHLPLEYLRGLLVGAATQAYYFIPLLTLFYLLSPLLVPLAKVKWRLLLVISALIQLFVLVLRYWHIFIGDFPSGVRHLFSMWFIAPWFFYYSLGLVVGFHQSMIIKWVTNKKWLLLLATIIGGIISIMESDIVFRMTHIDWVGPLTFSTYLYASAFILTFIAFSFVNIPFAGFFNYLGTLTFGIYLLHNEIIEFIANSIHVKIPQLLNYQIIFQPILISISILGPIGVMKLVQKSPLRHYYRYLFG